MRKYLLIIPGLLFFSLSLSANTMFLYSYEVIEGETSSQLSAINEGMMDELFEAAYIAFDNVAENNKIIFSPKQNLHDYLAMAKKGGARYFLAVNSVSHESMITKEAGEMDSDIIYYLYDAKTSELLDTGNLSRKFLFEKKSQIDQIFFEIGREIVKKIGLFIP